VAVAHDGCCVFCVLCVVFCLLAYFLFDFLFLSNQLVEIDLDKGQISKLCSVVNKKPQQKHPDTIRCPGAE